MLLEAAFPRLVRESESYDEGVGRRRQDQPGKFGDGFWVKKECPADPKQVTNSMARFLADVVIMHKRERARMLLTHRDRERRIEGLQRLPGWLRPETMTELGGAAGFPDRLLQRFGEIPGILVRESGALLVNAPHAAFLASGGSGALFLADAEPMALVFPEVGPPTLVLKARPTDRTR